MYYIGLLPHQYSSLVFATSDDSEQSSNLCRLAAIEHAGFFLYKSLLVDKWINMSKRTTTKNILYMYTYSDVQKSSATLFSLNQFIDSVICHYLTSQKTILNSSKAWPLGHWVCTDLSTDYMNTYFIELISYLKMHDLTRAGNSYLSIN